MKRIQCQLWRVSVAALVATWMVGSVAQASAEACVCAPDSLEESFETYDNVLVGTPLWVVELDGVRRSVVRIAEVYKGCLVPGDLVTVVDRTGACGGLPTGEALINGNLVEEVAGTWALDLALCGYNVPTSVLTREDVAYLEAQGPACPQACRSSDDCDADEYCALGGVCLEDATCEIPVDCIQEGNDYPIPRCVGYPSCSDAGLCLYQCGQGCIDLVGVDFGSCEDIMGYGMVEGACQAVRGCSPLDLGFAIYETLDECKAACR